MAAKANVWVPVVLRRGGLPEFVRHSETGCLCDSLKELKQHVLKLATHTPLMAALQTAARRIAARFSRGRFLARMAELLTPHGWNPR